MRLFLIVFVLLFQQSNSVAQNHVREPKASHVTNQEQQNVPNTNTEIFIGECLRYFQESAPAHDEKKANAYDPRNDALYRWYLRATIIGVAGAVLGLIILLLQTLHTGNQVTAMMNAERAFLIMDGTPKLDQGRAPYPFFIYKLVNVGKTPAILVEAHGSLEIGDADDPIPPDPSVYDVTKVIFPFLGPIIIKADSPTPHTEVGHSARAVERSETAAIFETDEKVFWACGFYIYRDVFGREYEQRFCHKYFEFEKLEGFYMAGPAEYNRLFTRKKITYRSKYQTR